MSGPELNATPAELLPSALSLNEARRRPSSYRPPSIYTRPDRQRARIAPLRRFPISSFTIFSTLPMASVSRSPAYYPAGWPAKLSGYGRGRSVLHQPRLARRSQLPPQAGAWFSNSPLQFSSMRSGELLHAGTAASTPIWASSLPHRTAPPVSVSAPLVPAAAPCRQRQKPGAWTAMSRWPASPCPPPSSRRSRTREAAATWDP